MLLWSRLSLCERNYAKHVMSIYHYRVIKHIFYRAHDLAIDRIRTMCAALKVEPKCDELYA